MSYTSIAAVAGAAGAVVAAGASMWAAWISTSSAKTWRKQIAVNFEYQEATNLKGSLNQWYREFKLEVEKDKDLTPKGIFNRFKKWRASNLGDAHSNPYDDEYYDPANIDGMVQFQKYVNDLKDKWLILELDFDKASFIEEDYLLRGQLRLLFDLHIEYCQSLINYVTRPSFGAIVNIQTATYVYQSKYSNVSWDHIVTNDMLGTLSKKEITEETIKEKPTTIFDCFDHCVTQINNELKNKIKELKS